MSSILIGSISSDCPKVAFDSFPQPVTIELGQYKNESIDVLGSIETEVRQLFFSINEAEPPNNSSKIDLIEINEFIIEWVLKPEFKASAFAFELSKNIGRLNAIIMSSKELYEKNKPEIEGIKQLDSYYQQVQVFETEIAAELSAAERSVTNSQSLPNFEQLFQKPLKYLGRIAKIAHTLERFPLLFAISADNVEQWVSQGLKSPPKLFRNINDASMKLVDNFIDLEADLDGLVDHDFSNADAGMVT